MAFIVIILAAVEALTEFIPVSSTAHLLLAGRTLGLSQDAFLEAFSICIQSGAILASVWYFWKTIWRNLSLVPKILVAFIPTGVVGVTLYPLIKLLLDKPAVIALALILGGVALVCIKPIDAQTRGIETISYKQAFLIGCAQVLSFVPGVSRAGATLIGGTALGIPRAHIVTFSFLLGIPTILGASAVEIRHVETLSSYQWSLIALGTAVAFVVALACIRFFISLLTHKPLSWFGWYRVALGIIVLLVFV